jgi:hypothetical protein
MRDIVVRKLMCTGFAGRPKIRWENDIKEDLRIMEINGQCIQDWVKWKAVVEKSKTFNVVVAPDEEEAEVINVMILLLERFFFSLVNNELRNTVLHCLIPPIDITNMAIFPVLAALLAEYA